MGNSLREIFIRGGWVMWPLLLCSILTWAIIFERGLTLVRIRPRLKRLGESVLRALQAGDFASAKQLCHLEKAPLGDLFLSAFEGQGDKNLQERAVERNRLRINLFLKKNLWILGTIGSASPFVGLLGTVLGIVRAFHDMSEKGTGGFATVSAGISEALVATAAGLIVAIVAVVAYNILTTAVTQTQGGLRLTLEEVMDRGRGRAH